MLWMLKAFVIAHGGQLLGQERSAAMLQGMTAIHNSRTAAVRVGATLQAFLRTLPQGQRRGPVSGHCTQCPAWHTASQTCLPQAKSAPHIRAQ